MQGRFRLLIITIVLSAIFMEPSMLKSQNLKVKINEYPVTFQFIHKVGSDSLVMDTMSYTNLFGNKYSVETLKYFVSNITLQKSNGDSLELKEAFYIDAADTTTSKVVTSWRIPSGSYSQISFIFGLDKSTNVSGKFLNPPENRMEWPETMGGGYHYLKLEGKIDAPGENRNFQAHMGQLNGIPHFFRVSFQNSSFTIDNREVTIQIVMDINGWWRNPHAIDLNNITAIMDNGPVQRQLMENGTGVFSIGSIK